MASLPPLPWFDSIDDSLLVFHAPRPVGHALFARD